MRTVLVFAAVALGSGAQADEGWTRARTAHVEVLASGEPQARHAAEQVETFHRVLQAALAGVRGIAEASRPPLVLAFPDRASFSGAVPLRNGEPQDVGGVTLGGADRTLIAVDLGAEEGATALAHEYAHHTLNPLLAAQPPWIGEGLAELLAQATIGPDSAVIGRTSDPHLRRIERDGLLPLRDVLSVGYLSPTYQGDGRALFYAQSWALAHWVVAGGHGGMKGLVAFTEAIADGDDPPSAFGRSFGMSVDAAQGSLVAYLASRPLPTLSVPLPIAGPSTPVEVSAVAEGEMEARFGDLLLRGGRIGEARSRFARALAAGWGDAHEGMADVLLREGKLEEAARHIEAALAAEPDGARALQRRAEHLVREVARRGDVLDAAETDRAVAILERALAVDPDLADAADLLARLRPAPLAQRIALLRRAVAHRPERAELAFTLSGLHVRRNDFGAAARVLRRARESTRDDAHRFLIDHILARIAAFADGQGVARGTLEAVECLAGGALAFRVRTPSGLLRLAAESAQSLFIYDAEGDAVERSFTCGRASLPVTARYLSGPRQTGTHQLLSLSFDDGR